MSDLPEESLSLHRVSELPLDFDDPVYAQYSLFKMGVTASVSYYAERLAPHVERWIADHPESTDWLLSAPAYDEIPAGANLLCRAVHEILAQAGTPASILEIRREKIDPAKADLRELGRANEYSKMPWQDRRESRVYWNSLTIEDPAFAGRPVIFINDINVTGAQQEGMRRYFERLGAASVLWAYILEVDEAIGRREPHIEEAINNSANLSVEALGRALGSADVKFTSKCIARIFAYEVDEMERLVALLGADRRAEVLRWAVLEGRYDGPEFRAQLDLLKAACAEEGATPRRSPPPAAG